MSEEELKAEPKIVQINSTTGAITEVPKGMEYSENSMAVGVVVPNRQKTSIDYLQSSRDYRVSYDTEVRDIIRLCNIMYMTEGIIGTAIDLFVDYAITDFEVDNLPLDSKERSVLDFWMANVNRDNENMEKGLRGLVSELTLEYWIAGNIFSYRKDSDVKSSDIDSKKMRNSNFTMPMDVFLLDPLFIKIPEYTTIVGGGKEVFMKLEDDFVTMLHKDEKLQEQVLNGFSLAERKVILDNKELPLDMEKLRHIKRKSRGYQAWGIPYLSKAFGAMSRKKKLQALDEATVDGLINHITIFKIGESLKDDPMKTTWDPRRLQAFASLLKDPNPSNSLVWYRDVDVVQVTPNENVLGLDKKYTQTDKELLKSLGIPTVLLAGEGSTADNTENVWVAISSLLEKIDSSRNQIKQYIEDLMFKILKDNKMDIKIKPELRWREPNLRNEKEFRDFTLAMYDRGLLPIEIAVKNSGNDWKKVLDGRVAEITEKIKGKGFDEIFQRRDLPFGTPTDGQPKLPSNDKTSKTDKTKKPKPVAVKPKTTLKKKEAEYIGKDMVDEMISDANKKIISSFESDKDNIVVSVGTSFEVLKNVARKLCDEYQIDYQPFDEKFNKISAAYIKSCQSFEDSQGMDLYLDLLSVHISEIFNELQSTEGEINQNE